MLCTRSELLYLGSISTSSADFGEAVTAVSQLSIDGGGRRVVELDASEELAWFFLSLIALIESMLASKLIQEESI